MFGQGLCKGILRLFGWKWEALVPDLEKSVVCVAPHTSNWISSWVYWATRQQDVSPIL